MEEETKKIWKYFFQQKKKEIGNVLRYIGVLLILSIISLIFIGCVGLLLSLISWLVSLIPTTTWLVILKVGLFIGGVSLVLGLIYWLRNNWIKAKRRVENEEI